MATSRSIKVNIEDEVKLLELTNDLRFILNNISETNDMWLSDLNNLRKLECKLEDVFNFDYDPKTYRYILKNSKRSKK
tara:strand:- start:2481 stop:2714 length:234 start_codon:yes stop_codon:yes gene_type:complete